ncbi:NADPH:quinone oxidoreductase family protein [Jannaschia sp. Os4]|uniref:NADPH:quinone oxidoreductase family protein n=1 Tax=Jannaschia sp. Os4 TaxID=2807617 RepID=UPI001939498A|nr:NADPH:quinone oxidoreductase family protein [Jannaschia sp. Os4]MBM2575344.1 NADPH:quinone oxidoreductase family protein [Jannaschia sp. Os4]
MRAFVATAPGRADLAEIAPPAPGPGEVLLRVRACGLNFADLLMIGGTYQDTPPLPFVPGMEMCGTVEAVGEGVAGPAVGTRVAAFCGRGGLGERAVVPAESCVPVPDDMPDAVAAGFLVAYSTSDVALRRRGRLAAGERLVVLGAAGGVGLTAVELGARMGAEVVAVARGAAKLEVARGAGAAHVIDAEAPDLTDRLRAAGGADVIYDAVGGDLARAAMRALRPEGRMLCIGFASGDVPVWKANHLLVKNAEAIGVYWGGYLRFAPEVVTESVARLMRLWSEGGLSPHVSHVLPLDRVEEALDLLRTRRATGKVVVAP